MAVGHEHVAAVPGELGGGNLVGVNQPLGSQKLLFRPLTLLRFFVDGQGLFYVHPDDKVYLVLCEQGDLISVPAHTRHWFDMGENPSLKAIRLFTTPEGWVAHFTGSDIARRFPKLEQFVAEYA